MRALYTSVLPLLCAAAGALGISQRDAGVHDWHKALIGQPEVRPGLSPRFHYPAGASNTAVSSLVYTATERNVLASIDPKTGNLVWRHVFPENQPILRYELHGDSILAVTGPGGSQVHLFSASTGHSLWTLDLHSTSEGLLPEPDSIATDVKYYQVSATEAAGVDVLTVENGRTMRRINGMTGQIAWSWKLDEVTEPTLQIHAVLPPAPGANNVQALMIKRTPGSYSLLITTLSRAGQVVKSLSAIKGSNFEALESLILFPPLQGTVEARAVFLDSNGDIKSVFIFAEGTPDAIVTTFKSKPKYTSLTDLGLSAKGIFVAVRADGSSSVLQVGSDGKVNVLYDYTDAVTNARYSGFTDRNDVTHVSRFSLSSVLGLARMAIVTLEGTEHNDAGMVFDTTFPYLPKKYGQLLHVTTEVAPRTGNALIYRLCITTASGTFQGWLGGGLQWSREEGLAHVTSTAGEPSIAFLAVPSTAHTAADAVLSSGAAGIKAMFEQPLRALGMLPPVHDLSTNRQRDWLGHVFGYRKIAIIGTAFGKIQALDVGNGGDLLWENYLVPLFGSSEDVAVQWKKISVIDGRSDGKVLLVAIAQVTSNAAHKRSQIFYLNGLTGRPLVDRTSEEALLKGGVDNVLEYQDNGNPIYVLATKDQTVVHQKSLPAHLISSREGATAPTQATLLDLSKPGFLRGFHALLFSGTNPVQAEEAWQYVLPAGQQLLAHARHPGGKLASVGRVLGDRSTLYKYVNPHVLAVATGTVDGTSLAIRLIDTITGELIWEALHEDEADIAAGVAVTLTDNWLAYSFVDRGSEGRSTRLMSVELFEEPAKDTQISNVFSSYGSHKVFTISKAFVYPGKIVGLATSQTKHGVTTKTLLVTTATDQIVAVPRRLLDPRRPMQKPTKHEMEEYLMPYDPLLPVEPKWVISHRARVAGIQGILTSPTILESTSQVLAYGLDLFGSSVSPSGRFDVLSQDFNKLQLIGTTLALMVAIGVLKPMVQRKKLNERWYPAS